MEQVINKGETQKKNIFSEATDKATSVQLFVGGIPLKTERSTKNKNIWI